MPPVVLELSHQHLTPSHALPSCSEIPYRTEHLAITLGTSTGLWTLRHLIQVGQE